MIIHAIILLLLCVFTLSTHTVEPLFVNSPYPGILHIKDKFEGTKLIEVNLHSVELL